MSSDKNLKKNNMEKAIKKAIEGGYATKCCQEFNSGSNHHLVLHEKEYFWCNPLFWQALGKAEGWDDDIKKLELTPIYYVPRWRREWHRFIDHLAEGKDAESFFNELLK